MNAPACLNCHVAMKCHRTGAYLELMTATGGYQIWSADLFKCECCGALVANSFAQKPIAEHFEVDYEDTRITCRPQRYWATPRDKDKWEDAYAPVDEEVRR